MVRQVGSSSSPALEVQFHLEISGCWLVGDDAMIPWKLKKPEEMSTQKAGQLSLLHQDCNKGRASPWSPGSCRRPV